MKNSLIKDDTLFASSYQNFIVNKFIHCLDQYGSKTPLVIAGSTGSLSAGKKLIKAISEQTNGFVILNGLSELEGSLEEYHPQFLLGDLLKFLKAKKENIENIEDEKFELSPKDRLNFINAAMLPNQETLKWQNLNSLLDVKKASQDLANNFKLIEAKDELEEARIVAVILKEASCNNKRSAVITNNEKLAHLLRHELARLSLGFNDSRNIGLSNSKLAHFILLVLELLESDFASSELLAILKNPLFKNGQYLEEQILKDFEIEVLRQERTASGIVGIEERLKLLNNKELSEFLCTFL